MGGPGRGPPPCYRARMLRFLLGALALLAACTPADPPRVRPTNWAQPVLGKGVENWFQVSPEVYRCAQPSSGEMRALAAFGVKSVVNLREHHSDDDEVAGTGLELREVQLGTSDLTYAQLCEALRAVLAAKKPVVVHCWHGSDRTGAVVAAFRVAVQGWTPAAALDEMVAGGYGHSALFGNLRELVGGLDAAKLRADVGLPGR
ncbi:MAG: protein tyrosine phosphatase [Planctomycetes bacterium]|nr:protein tyrosine phosphatase [Planctomycetota bacterium]